MSRVCRHRVRLKPIDRDRLCLAILAGLGVLSICLVAASTSAATEDRIAVASFADAGRVSDASQVLTRRERAAFVANALAERLALRHVQRLIGPGDFVAKPSLDPRAEDVRKWAYNAAVDAILVGRVTSTTRAGRVGVSRIEVALRSGHSGGELSRYDIAVAGRGELDAAIDELATLIWRDLGHPDDAIPVVGAGPADSGEPGRAEKESPSPTSGHGLEAPLAFAGFESRAPIEIKADEAEIIAHEDGRELVFRHNVRVRQDNVTLRSDRLEASYGKGESEPRRLVANGRVKIEQGDRRAACDQATYVRDESRLTCRGNAELIQGCDVVRGEAIEFDLDGDQARVQGAASIVIRPRNDAGASCETRMGAR
jgi:lipopolysaccharide transport protein LptA